MKIDFKVRSHWNCQICQLNGIPEGDDKCDYCGYSGHEIQNWIKERELVNFLIDEYNKGQLLIKS